MLGPEERSSMVLSLVIPETPSRSKSQPLTIEKWMQKVTDAAMLNLSSSNQGVEYPVDVTCHFKLDRSAKKYDLDNLIKCLIDALGAAKLFNPSSTGGHRTPRNTDDWWVRSIHAQKTIVTNGCETRVEVRRKQDN